MPLPNDISEYTMFQIVIFEPTLRCGLGCPMCDRLSETTGSAELDLDEMATVVDRLPPSIEEAYISGGEPTLYRHLPQLCRMLRARGIVVSLQTNGTHPDMVEKVLDVGVDHFNVSVDGPEETHDRIRGKGKFARTMASMALIRDAGRQTVTTTVISEYNLGSLPQIFAHIKKNRVRPHVMIFELARRFDQEAISASAALMGIPHSEVAVRASGSRFFPFAGAELASALETIVARANTYRQKIMFLPGYLLSDWQVLYDRANRENHTLHCTHKKVLRIDSSGTVIPCFTFRYPFGNLLHESLDDVVHGARWHAFWERLENSNLAPTCETCFRARRVES